jgi:hypothetical protein
VISCWDFTICTSLTISAALPRRLSAIYVLPQWQRLGLGHRLFGGVVSPLGSAGVDTIVTWVLAANPSRAFFESLGGTAAASTTSRSGLAKVAYTWCDRRDSWPMRLPRLSSGQRS